MYTQACHYFTISCFLVALVKSQLVSPEFGEAKTFTNYENDLIYKYKSRNYLAAIFENATVRNDFTRFINSRLTPEVKSDLKAVRVFKKVGDIEVPVVSFSANMDSWLGVLPQWKRTKKFLFNQLESFVDSHQEILEKTNNGQKPSPGTSQNVPIK